MSQASRRGASHQRSQLESRGRGATVMQRAPEQAGPSWFRRAARVKVGERGEGWRGGMQASTRANEEHKIRTKWEGNGDRKPHPNRDGFASPTGVIAAATRCLRHGARRALHLRARQRLQRTHRGRGAVIGLALRPGLALPPPFSGDPIFGCAFSGATLERVARLDRGVWSRPHPTYRRAAPEPVPHPVKIR